MTQSFPRVRYAEEPKEGLDFARNRAVEETDGQIIVFLDDDAVASRNWLRPLMDAFERNSQLALCFGRVEALTDVTPGAQLFEKNGGFGRGTKPIDLPDGTRRHFGVFVLSIASSIVTVGSGCSMAVRRTALAEIGGFDAALDLGHELPGGGDLDVIWRFLEAGFQVRYEPASLAKHEHRADEASAVRQIIEHNRSLIATLMKMIMCARGSSRIGAMAFLGWRLLKPGIRILYRLSGRDPLPINALVRLWWACWRGLIAYPAAQRLSTKRKFQLNTPK